MLEKDHPSYYEEKRLEKPKKMQDTKAGEKSMYNSNLPAYLHMGGSIIYWSRSVRRETGLDLFGVKRENGHRKVKLHLLNMLVTYTNGDVGTIRYESLEARRED